MKFNIVLIKRKKEEKNQKHKCVRTLFTEGSSWRSSFNGSRVPSSSSSSSLLWKCHLTLESRERPTRRGTWYVRTCHENRHRDGFVCWHRKSINWPVGRPTRPVSTDQIRIMFAVSEFPPNRQMKGIFMEIRATNSRPNSESSWCVLSWPGRKKVPSRPTGVQQWESIYDVEAAWFSSKYNIFWAAVYNVWRKRDRWGGFTGNRVPNVVARRHSMVAFSTSFRSALSVHTGR